MGIVATLNAVKNFIEDNYYQFSHGNLSIQSESIFNNLLSIEECEGKGIIVEYAGTSVRDAQASEFGGTLLKWRISTTIFAVLSGTQEEEYQQIMETYGIIDSLIDKFKDYPTLNGAVMDIAFDRSEPPFVYERQSINQYLMVTIYWSVTENF